MKKFEVWLAPTGELFVVGPPINQAPACFDLKDNEKLLGPPWRDLTVYAEDRWPWQMNFLADAGFERLGLL